MAALDIKNARVLIVEDDPASKTLIKQLLSAMEITRVVEASNGRSALNKLYLNRVDLIVADWLMPDMDGLEFYKSAHKAKLLDNTRFLMVSVVNQEEALIKAFSAGITDYMLKPLERGEFQNKVKSLFSQKAIPSCKIP
jgi:PleD family two-component response regulator